MNPELMSSLIYFDEAKKLCLEAPAKGQRISIPYLQRCLKIGFNSADRLVDQLIKEGVLERYEVYKLRLAIEHSQEEL